MKDNLMKTKRSRILIQLVIVLGFLGVVWFSFGYNVLGLGQPSGVPGELGEMKLARVIEGDAAKKQISQLHGLGIEMDTAFIAEYSHTFNPYHSSNDEKVVVWVGKTNSSSEAALLLERMITGITKGNSGFDNLKQLSVIDNKIFTVTGPGGSHFFYVPINDLNEIFWLTVTSPDPLAVLELVLNSF